MTTPAMTDHLRPSQYFKEFNTRSRSSVDKIPSFRQRQVIKYTCPGSWMWGRFRLVTRNEYTGETPVPPTFLFLLAFLVLYELTG